PALGYNVIIESPMTPLDRMAARLKELGIVSVSGNIVGDATVFDDALIGPNWPSDTGGGAARYAPRVSGLPFQRNMPWVEAVASPIGGDIEIRTDPQVTAVPVVSTVNRGSGGARVLRYPADDTVRIVGAVSG